MAPSRKRETTGRAHTVELSSTSQDLAVRMAQEQQYTHCLVIMGGLDVGTTLRLTLPEVVVGRDADCDLTLSDDGISRRHAAFRLEGSTYAIEDLGSTNGVFLNGSRIGKARLDDGDKVLLGRFTILKYERQDDLELEYQRRLQESLSLDGLTGILNRRALDQRLQSEWSFAARHNTALSALMLDVDHFKKINDTYGHAAGDQVLRALSAAVQDAIRGEDIFGRYGGEEFVVVARDIGHQGAMMLARRLRQVVMGLQVQADGRPVTVTVSIGVATVSGDYSASPAELVRAADRRLYAAKNSGRNREVGDDRPPSP